VEDVVHGTLICCTGIFQSEGHNCDIQVVRQLGTKLGSIRCKHSIKYIVVQSNKGMIVNYKSYKFSCASMWKCS
jgi:hypothetical protein